ncbi:RNA polymerase sigma factor [Parabacteroides sp. OttesenSCG-928-N08]|nr:RNA polymerase sigma factor [Parabacteroides sp. OttesenSCG-928-N08]
MEQEQFKQEVVPLRNELLIYAQRLLNHEEEAEDIVQEVFLKLWDMRAELGGYNSIAALATTITKHLCLNRNKQLQRTQGDFDAIVVVSDTASPHQQLEEKDNVSHLMRLIDQLPGLQQTILRMKHVDGFEVEEIAQLTGSSADAVRMNLSRARRRVRQLFINMH